MLGKTLSQFPLSADTASAAAATGNLGRFANNASNPQVADYARVAGYALVFMAAMSGAGPSRASTFVQQLNVQSVAAIDQQGTRTVWASRRAGQTPPIIRMVYGAPQLVDLTQQGQVWPSTKLGQTTPLIPRTTGAAQPYTNAPSTVWPSQRTPAVTAQPVTAFVQSADQPQDRPTVTRWPSQRLGQVTPIIKSIAGAPQLVDLTQQALLIRPAIGQLPALPWVSGAGQAYTDSPSSVWRSLIAGSTPRIGAFTQSAEQPQDRPTITVWPSQRAPAVTAQPVTAFVRSADQPQDRPTATVWPSQRAGQTPPVIRQVSGAPLQTDLTQQAVLFAPVIGRLPALPWVYGIGQVYTDSPSFLWASQRAGQPPPVIPLVLGRPQADPTQIAPQLFPTVRTPPITTGLLGAYASTREQFQERPTVTVWPALVSGSRPRIIPQLWAEPQRVDLTQQASIFASLIGRLPALPYVAAAGQAYTDAPSTVRAALFTPPVLQALPVWVGTRPQLVDLTQQGTIWPPVKLQQGIVRPMVRAAPQLLDLTQPARYFPQAYAIPITDFGSSRNRIGAAAGPVLSARLELRVGAVEGPALGTDAVNLLNSTSSNILGGVG